MTVSTRDRLALLVAILAAVLGVVALSIPIDPGVRLSDAPGDRLVVASLGRYPGQAAGGWLQPGMVVVSIDGRELVHFPEWGQNEDGSYYRADAASTPGPPAQPVPSAIVATPPPAAPATVSIVPLPADELAALASSPFSMLAAVRPEALDVTYQPGQSPDISALNLSDLSQPLEQSQAAWAIGMLVLVIGGWWLLHGSAGATLRAIAVPLAVAIAVPLVMLPSRLSYSGPLLVAAAILVPLSLVPLALGFGDLVDDRAARRAVAWASAAAAGLAVAIGLAMAQPDVQASFLSSAQWVAAGGIVFLPGLAAAGPALPRAGPGVVAGRPLVERTELLVAALTPPIALIAVAAPGSQPLLIPLLAWIAIVLLAGRFTFRPLARIATRATLQRDLVVAAMEAERQRLAADLHDDALQDVTMLVRRLESAGDEEGADLARGVADRLRAISGDLRLPILDDLGVGPALDWLVSRIERLAGGEVRLELADGRRPPDEVELAVFRVAQEALANAVKHGRPPIVVRYRASELGVSLSVDDAGVGIDPSASEAAPAADHFGLLNMQQRAEQIGAILDIRRWPGGGTHVALEWRPR